MEEEQKPKGPGRPRVEHTMPTEWEKIILEAGHKGKFRVGTTFKDILEDLRKDIEMSEQSNRFELAAVMTDVRNSLMEVVDELDKQHKDQLK